MTTEVWKTIPAFDDYEASSLGRIRSKPRVRRCKNGQLMPMQGRVLVEMIQSGKGYKRVNLYRGKKMSQHGVHCLVALAFFGAPNGRYVNHIDFDVTNNCVENLEYCTPAENIQHSARHGRLVSHSGEKNPMAKLTTTAVREIADRVRNRERDEVIASDFAVAKATITCIRLGKIWSHVTGFRHSSFRVVRGRKRASELIAAGCQLAFAGIEESTGVARFNLVNKEKD
jgi:hypothetical protein